MNLEIRIVQRDIDITKNSRGNPFQHSFLGHKYSCHELHENYILLYSPDNNKDCGNWLSEVVEGSKLHNYIRECLGKKNVKPAIFNIEFRKVEFVEASWREFGKDE